MKVAFDTVILGAYLHPGARYPQPVDRIPERLDHLVNTLERKKATIIVPTPALSEFLAYAGRDSAKYLSELAHRNVFRMEAFDQKAAIEAAVAHAQAAQHGDKKDGAIGSWQRVKVDRQIVAIAKVHNVDCLYSGENDVRKLGSAMGVTVKGLEDLPLPSHPHPTLFGANPPVS